MIPTPTTRQFLCSRFHLASPMNGSDTLLVCLLKKKSTNHMVKIFLISFGFPEASNTSALNGGQAWNFWTLFFHKSVVLRPLMLAIKYFQIFGCICKVIHKNSSHFLVTILGKSKSDPYMNPFFWLNITDLCMYK